VRVDHSSFFLAIAVPTTWLEIAVKPQEFSTCKATDSSNQGVGKPKRVLPANDLFGLAGEALRELAGEKR
jgi:hypothetical protein